MFYLLGVQHTSPGNAQLLIQLAPLLMALGGIFVFREHYRPGQWLGLAMIAAGWRCSSATRPRRSPWARALTCSVRRWWCWRRWSGPLYALMQKQLLTRLASPAIQVFIYLLASVVLLPLAHPRALLALDARHAWLLAFCAINTLVAYGAFAEALAHWEASRVSAILATTPLLTLATIAAVHGLWPEAIAAERVGAWGYVGAAAWWCSARPCAACSAMRDPPPRVESA